MNVSAYRNVMSSLEEKNLLYNTTFIATREGQYGGKVDFNTVYGTNSISLPSVTEGVIKDSDTTLIIDLPTIGDYVEIASTNVNDTALGTGCRSVYLEGLNDDKDKINETLPTNGQTPVRSTKKFFRVNRMVSSTQGTNTDYVIQGMRARTSPNLGTIYCGKKNTFTAGIPTEIYSTIQANIGWSRQAICGLPRNYFPIMRSVAAAPGGGRMVKFSVNFSFGWGAGMIKTFTWYGFQQVSALDFFIGGIYYTGGDIEVTALADGGGVPGMIKLEFVLVRNDLLTEVLA